MYLKGILINISFLSKRKVVFMNNRGIKEYFSIKNIARYSIIAALYVVLSLFLAPITFGPIQFRISEVLVLICFYRKDYSIPLIIGCFITNLFSPYFLLDITLGTLSTVIACLGIMFSKKLIVACVFPPLSLILVGIEITIIDKLPLYISIPQVMLGEAIVIFGIAFPLWKYLEKNRRFMEFLGCEVKNKDN